MLLVHKLRHIPEGSAECFEPFFRKAFWSDLRAATCVPEKDKVSGVPSQTVALFGIVFVKFLLEKFNEVVTLFRGVTCIHDDLVQVCHFLWRKTAFWFPGQY